MFLNLPKNKSIRHPLISILMIIGSLQASIIYKDNTVKDIAFVKSGTRIDSIKVSFNLPELSNDDGKYSINGVANNNLENGAPHIPVVEKLIRVKNSGEVNVQIVTLSNKSLDSKVPRAYRLPLSQSGLVAPIKYDTSAFEFFKNTPPVYLKSLEIIGDYRVARIAYSPLRFNNTVTTGIVTKCEVLITTSDIRTENDFKRKNKIEESRFIPFYKDILNVDFDNVRQNSRQIIPTYCFIGSSETLEAVQELINWKIRKGLNVIIANTDDIGSSNTQIDSWIEETYQSVNGLMFVLLVGDEDIVASNRMNCPYSQVQSPSDNGYGVIGSGYHPTVHVGRLTTAGKGIGVHEYQAWKIVKYESEPEEGPWMTKSETWGCSSPNGQPSASYWQDILEGAGMDCNMELEAYGAAKGMTLVGHFNEGLTTFAMKGHGNDQSWHSASIGQTQVSAMTNGMKQPWINNIACLNSRFQYSSYTCFAEAMMTTGTIGDAKGSIGMYSYTISSSGGSPTQGSDGMLTAIYESLFEDDVRHVGLAASYGTAASGTSGDKKGSMLWGCPEMDVFFKYPLDSIDIICEKPAPGYYSVLTDVAGALVSVVTKDFEPLASGYTDGTGSVTFNLPDFNTETYLTVTSRNCIPVLKEYDATSLNPNIIKNTYGVPQISLKNNNLLVKIADAGRYELNLIDIKGRTLFTKSCDINSGSLNLSLNQFVRGNQTIIVEIITPQNKKFRKPLLFM